MRKGLSEGRTTFIWLRRTVAADEHPGNKACVGGCGTQRSPHGLGKPNKMYNIDQSSSKPDSTTQKGERKSSVLIFFSRKGTVAKGVKKETAKR